MFARIGNVMLSANTSLHVIGLMAFLPFITMYHRLPIPSFYGEWLAAALGAIALLPLLKRESWQPLDIPHIALIFPGFLAILFIQWMLGMLYSTQYALLVASYLVWAFFLAMLGSHLRRQLGWEKISGTLAWYLLAGGVGNTIFVLLQYAGRLGVEVTFITDLPGYGAIGQLNHFADYMALALASLLYLLAKKRLSVSVAVVFGLLFLTMLAFSGSRSSWLYLVALAVLAFLLRAMSIRQSSSTPQLQLKQSRSLFRLALVLMPLFALVQWLVYYLPGGVALPTERLFDEFGGNAVVGGWAVRLHFWYESLLLFIQSPWVGIGMGQSRWMSFTTLDAHWVKGMPAVYEHSHNLIIHLLAEMGIAAALLLLAGVFAWLRGFSGATLRWKAGGCWRCCQLSAYTACWSIHSGIPISSG
jgi:O-antigen ligase